MPFKNVVPFINGTLVFPLLERFSGRQIKPKLRELKEFEKLSREGQRQVQRDELCKMLLFCKEKVPFYQDLFSAHHFEIEKVQKDIRYLQELPLLTKDIIKERTEQIKLPSALHARKTGGSTGQSVFFFYDSEGLDWTSAINRRALEMTGKKSYHVHCMTSADQEILQLGSPDLKGRLINWIKAFSQSRIIMMISSLSEESMGNYYHFLKKHRPYSVQGHPSSIYGIANYVEKNIPKKIPLFKVFEPSGEMLTAKMVQTIEENLKCKVANRYGNAECGVMAHSRLQDSFNQLRVFDRAFYLEECQQAPLVVTTLTNFGFPLIRYDTGDIGTVIDQADGTVLQDIQGRIHDLIQIGDRQYPTHFIMDFLDHKVGKVRAFQVLLQDHSLPTLCIVPEIESDQKRIASAVQELWGSQILVKFIPYADLVTVGWRQKFKFVVDQRGRENESRL